MNHLFQPQQLNTSPLQEVQVKQIAPDIFLEKKIELRLEGGDHPRYKFTLVSRSLRVISFEVDFDGSRNIELYQDSVLTDSTVLSRRVEPLVRPD
jgi:hypothetical protein